MAGSGEIERAVAGSGEVDRAVAVSSEVERAMAGSGKDELSPLHSLDYPCTARLRRRRLFASLRWYSWELYQAAKMIMPVIFHTKDLVKKVQEGQWQEARCYIDRFAPFINSGYEAKLLMLFLHDFMILNGFADGRAMPRSYLWDWLNSIYQKPVLDKYPCFATLVDDVLSKRNDHARAFLDWQLVRNKAAKVAKEVAYKTSELRERMHYPCGRSDLYHVVPVGSRCRVKKNFSRKQSTDLAQYYLQMNKRLPSSTQGRNHSDPELRGEPLLALFETSLKAGRRPEEGVPFVRTTAARPSCHIDLSNLVGHFNIGSRMSKISLMNSVLRKLELTSKLGTSGTSKRFSSVVSPDSNSAMKRSSFQECCRDSARPENKSKRPRTTGKFGDDPSSSFRTLHLVNEGSASEVSAKI